MELTTLRQFVAIARAGHLTRAAQALGVTQPALSAMLKKLERETGAPLLHRTGRGVELTEAGRLFLEHAQDALRRADDGVRAVQELVGLQRESIRVGGGATATTYLLPGVVRDVRARYPGLRFYVREAGSSAVAAAVSNGELDLGIVTLPLAEAMSAELTVTPLVEDELRLILPPSGSSGRAGSKPVQSREAAREVDRTRAGKTSIAAKRQSPTNRDLGGTGLLTSASGAARLRKGPLVGFADSTGRETGATKDINQTTALGLGANSPLLALAGPTFRWKDLEGVPVVAFEAGTAVRSLIDQSAARAGVTLNVVMELRSIESIKQMVAAGIGVGFVSRFAIEPRGSGGAHRGSKVEGERGLICKDGNLSRRLAIIKRAGRPLSAAAGEFERSLAASVQRAET